MSVQTTLDNYFKITNNKHINMNYYNKKFSQRSDIKKSKKKTSNEPIIISDGSDTEDFVEKKQLNKKIQTPFRNVKRKLIHDKKRSTTKKSLKKGSITQLESSPSKIRKVSSEVNDLENSNQSKNNFVNSPTKSNDFEKISKSKPIRRNIFETETISHASKSFNYQLKECGVNLLDSFVESDVNVVDKENSFNIDSNETSSNNKSTLSEEKEMITYSSGCNLQLPSLEGKSEEQSFNLSQNSDRTEEYDVSEYEETVGKYILISNIDTDNGNDACTYEKSNTNKLPGVNDVKNRVSQTDFPNIPNKPNEMNKSMIDKSIDTSGSSVRIKEERKETNESNENKIQHTSSNIDVKTPIDKRYSEENHQRLCLNVDKISDWVLENFNKLFDQTNTRILNSLLSLDNVLYKIFCLRLFTRQDKWYNIKDLCKTLNIDFNDGQLNKMLKILEERKLIDTDLSKEPVPDLLNLLNKPKIREICIESKLNKTPNKKDIMVNALLKNSTTQRTLNFSKTSNDILKEKIIVKLGYCVKLSSIIRDILNKLHILFSLANPELEKPNDIYWLLNRIHYEQIQYPNFTVDTVEIFRNCSELDEYVEAKTLRQQLNDQIQNKEHEDSYLLTKEALKRFKIILDDSNKKVNDGKKPLFIRRFTAGWIYCSIISIFSSNSGKLYPNEVCEFLQFLLKQNIYCVNKRGKWFEQLVLVTQSHLKNLSDAVDFIILAINDEFVSEISKYDLSNRGRKIHKNKLSGETYEKLQLCLLPEIDPFPSRTFQCNVVHDNVPGRKKSFIRNTSSGKEYGSVEETAINFYKDEGIYQNGIHCEGRILCTLFYLLFWDIIYNVHVPNTFISNIQCYPLDMFSGEFYKNRSCYINERINFIGNVWSIDYLCEFIVNVWCDNSRQLSSLISYDFEDVNQLGSIVRCIGNKVISAVCERCAKDFRLHRAGLPDLFLWDPSKNKCAFVEVKSEKDKLSTKQILWLNYLMSIGAKIEVCFVQEIGSRSKRNPN